MRMFRLVILVTIITGLVAGAVRYQKIRQRIPKCRDCNLIILSLDTFSGQHLPCNGYPRDTAPNLCAFSERNVSFPHAYGNAVYTLPTHVTMFTGLYPSTHGIIMSDGTNTLQPDTPFLPSVLKQQGYRTIFVIPPDNIHMPKDRVYNRGIDTFLNEYKTSLRDALDRFSESVAKGNKTFLFIHSYAVHAPYTDVSRPLLYTNDWYDWIIFDEADPVDITPGFIEFLTIALSNALSDGRYNAERIIYQGYLDALKSAAGDHVRQKRIALSNRRILNEYRAIYDPLLRIDLADTRHLDFFKAVYDQKIHEFDAGDLSRFLAAVSDPGIRDSTVVVITSDHGEDFGEHGYISHSTLFDSNTNVVLTMAVPGAVRRRIEDNVQTADIMPTVLDILGVPSPYRFDGADITPLIEGQTMPPRLLRAIRLREQTIRSGRWKLFVDTESADPVPTALYDIATDPYETKNVLFTHMSEARRMLGKPK